MPRDGSNVYGAPGGTLASPNTTIESSKYNAFVADLVVDLNAARPVSAGGTGRTAARLLDGTWRFENTADPSKLFALDLSGIAPATTRTAKVPNYNGTLSLQSKGGDIATAGTIDLSAATGQFVDLTGTVTVTAVTLAEGLQRLARAAANFQITVGASLIGNGGINLAVKAGDLLLFEGYAAGVVRFWCIPAQGGFSAADKTKLDGIEAGAQVNPVAATTSADGLMAAADKTKLNGIAAGATVGQPVPTSNTYAVGSVILALYSSATAVADGATCAGSLVTPAFVQSAGTISAIGAQTGTWRNISGLSLISSGSKGGYFVRVS